MAKEPTAPLPVPTEPPPHRGVLGYLGFAGCVRLPIRIDAPRLAGELARLPGDVWGRADRDPVVQASVESFFALGHPRGPRPLPPEDQPVLASLPYLRELLHEVIPARPTRAIVARLLPLGLIPIHTDTPRFFRATVRLSIQVAAAGAQKLYCDGLWYDFAPGEVWALDNLRPHAFRNTADEPRTNVLVDCLPANPLVDLIVRGDHDLGVPDPAARAALESATRARYRANRWRSLRYEVFKLLWRRTERHRP